LEPKLTVIVVNYNVKYFLEQALISVRIAAKAVPTEIWVVDNNSVDGSVDMVQARFSEVNLIANKHNPGFSVANNQAIVQSHGQYVLLLNPDTVVEADTFKTCCDFMDAHPEAGALGVRMIDGTGHFLPESKRGFPSAWVAFCKTFGLSRFFPKSRLFNYYHLGFIDELQTAEVDVLAGAFMWMRRSVLDEVGLLDEAFFMYGEDIDLSYRIQKAGYKNYYLPTTSIIHYKGESTKRGSLNYVKVFYQAMIIFARKHFSGRNATMYIMLLQSAIWFRAALTVFSNVVQAISKPLVDAACIWVGYLWLKQFWGTVYFKDPHYYEWSYMYKQVPLYVFIWLSSVWLYGGYDRGANWRRVTKGIVAGTIALAVVYSFMDITMRSSRMLIVLGSVWALISTYGWRAAWHLWRFKNLPSSSAPTKQILLVGSAAEIERATQLLYKAQVNMQLVGQLVVGPNDQRDLYQLDDMVMVLRANEVIFCARDVEATTIMHWMSRLSGRAHVKILPEDSINIIGSRSKNEPGELYVLDVDYKIREPRMLRVKRLTDICMAFTVLLLLPVLMWSNGTQMIRFIFEVLAGTKTWVSYLQTPDHNNLPKIKPGILAPYHAWPQKTLSDDVKARICFLYARDYSPERDVEVVWRNLFSLYKTS
jgi:GT2 family glycosyltransferase